MFDMLLESGQRSSLLPSWGKGVALALHVLVLGALWRPPESPAPAPVVEYFDVRPPGPVTASRDEGLPSLPDRVVCQCGPIEVPPIAIPDIPDGTLKRPIVDTRGAAASTGSTTSVSPTDVYPISQVQEAPELLAAPMPVYPPLLRAAGVRGRVIVAAVVDTLGQAEAGSVRIVLSDNPGFDASALGAVRAARFRPARLYGRAVRVLVQIPVVFRLD